jgi:four helix bundle protein
MAEGTKGQDICDRTRAFAVRVIKLYQSLVKDETGRVLGRQLLRSGTAIGAQVEEAQAAESPADFAHKMTIALKEARETRYWLTLIIEAELVPASRLESLLSETEEIIKVIYTIIQNSKKNN